MLFNRIDYMSYLSGGKLASADWYRFNQFFEAIVVQIKVEELSHFSYELRAENGVQLNIILSKVNKDTYNNRPISQAQGKEHVVLREILTEGTYSISIDFIGD
jgi:hypothetical protein